MNNKPQTPICQSCGMPMVKERDFGINKDSSKNEEYCHFCFKNGDFTDVGITLNQKIDEMVNIAVSEMQISEDEAREKAEKLLPTLKRWKQ